jgi:hypothetical protein
VTLTTPSVMRNPRTLGATPSFFFFADGPLFFFVRLSFVLVLVEVGPGVQEPVRTAMMVSVSMALSTSRSRPGSALGHHSGISFSGISFVACSLSFRLTLLCSPFPPGLPFSTTFSFVASSVYPLTYSPALRLTRNPFMDSV